jgi:hypothetical protein
LGNHTKHLQAIGVARIGYKDLLIEPFGFDQATGLMMLEGFSEHPFYRYFLFLFRAKSLAAHHQLPE